MTKKELENRLENLETELFREECKDRGYNFKYAAELKAEIAKTEKMLATM